MAFWSNWFGMASGTGLKFRWGVTTDTVQSRETEEIVSSVYSCCKILSDNVGRMPILVKKEDETGIAGDKEHPLWSVLHNTPNSYQNPSKFWSTLEYHRNYFGNGLAQIYRFGNGEVSHFEIIHPSTVIDAKKVEGKLFYNIQRGNKLHIISSDEILHFSAISEDGVFGQSPVAALEKEISVLQKAEDTLESFYSNKATATMALKSVVGDSKAYSVLKKAQEDFVADYGGAANAGKPITLPPNTELISIAANHADAQMVETMNLKKQDVAGVFTIPMYMLGETNTGDNAEQSSLMFRNYTISPIAKIYRSELEFKLLTEADREAGVTIEFDLDALVEADLSTRTKAIAEQVKSGLMTPNEGAIKMGNSVIDGEYGNMHYMQAQYIPLEQYGEYNVFDKEGESGDKPKDKPTKEKEEKDEDAT